MTSSTDAASPTAPPLPGYEHVYSGKVRDLYAPLLADGRADDERLLLVASDRISAYDFVLDTVVPDKGAVLTQLSLWWFDQLATWCRTTCWRVTGRRSRPRWRAERCSYDASTWCRSSAWPAPTSPGAGSRSTPRPAR